MVTTSTDNHVIYDMDERGGIAMAASENGIIKSFNGNDWNITSLNLPCETIRAIGGESWIAGGSDTNISTWISYNNGNSWDKLHFFTNNGLTPSDIVSMPHPEYINVPSHDITVFGCKNDGGLWVRYYNAETGTYKYYNPHLLKKGYISVLSLCYHKSSGWLFAGLDKKVNGYTVWMTKDCTKWYPVYATTGQVKGINVIDSNDNSYIFISDTNKNGYVWADLNTLEEALQAHYNVWKQDGSQMTFNITWKESTNSTIINPKEGHWSSSYSLQFSRSKTIKCADGSETLLMVHSDGIGSINSYTPSTETIIYSY